MKIIYTLIAAAAILTGCIQNRNVEVGPSETVELFYKAIFSGDFDTAESHCDTLLMKDYINSLDIVWNKADSSLAAIIPAILSETAIDITSVEKNGQIRTVFYMLTAADGQNKKKAATLRKEEGAWKIEAITDRY